MPSQWDHHADKDLLLCIIESGKLNHIDWKSIATSLGSKGYTFTHEACRQHYQKIRRESREFSSSNGTLNPSTPSKANGSKSSTSKTSTSRKTKARLVDENDDDEEDFNATPSKRQKTEKFTKEKTEMEDLGGFVGQNAMAFKREVIDEDGRGGVVDLDNDNEYYD